MTEAEIEELFIRAAEVERKLPNTARPARLKAMNMGYLHSFEEMIYWPEEELKAANWAWLDPKNLKVTTKDVGIWEAAMEVMKLCPDPRKRRALWAWAKAQTGGQSFAKWCKADGNGDGEGISRQLGEWRKNVAIECIVAAFARKPLQHNENTDEPDFTNRPEIGDKNTTMKVWRPDESKPVCDFDADLRDFSWAEAQNERRRQREKRAA